MPYSLREMAANIARTFASAENPPPRPCRRCQKEWKPKGWNFYDLCEDCFVLFNTQKMRGRFSVFSETPIPYTESCEEWMGANPYNEDNPTPIQNGSQARIVSAEKP